MNQEVMLASVEVKMLIREKQPYLSADKWQLRIYMEMYGMEMGALRQKRNKKCANCNLISAVFVFQPVYLTSGTS